MSTHIDDLDADPILIPHKGRLQWLFPSGRMVPDVSGGDGDDDEKKFTQADVDRMIAARVKNLKAEPPTDYDQLKADSAELGTLKAANAKAEAAKATAEEATATRIAALEAAVAKSNEDAEAARKAALEQKRHSAIVAAAAAQKALKPEQVAALLDKDAVTIGDDGRVTGAEDAVKAFIEANPHHVGEVKTGRPAPDKGQGKAGEGKSFGEAGRAEAAKRFPQPAGAGAGAQQ